MSLLFYRKNHVDFLANPIQFKYLQILFVNYTAMKQKKKPFLLSSLVTWTLPLGTTTAPTPAPVRPHLALCPLSVVWHVS